MRCALCLAALVFASAASAQTPDTAAQAPDTLAAGPTVTIAEAVRIALDRSPDLARATVADRSADLAVRAARAERLPTLALQVQPAQQLGLAFDQTTGQLTSQSVQTVNLGVGADLRLFDGGRTRYAVEGARLDREAAAVGVTRTEQQVALDVAQRFLQLLLDRELVVVQAGQLAAAESQRAQVAGLVEGGARARGDLIAQDAVVAERRAALVEAEGAVARDEALLVQSTGLDPLAPPTFVGPSLAALEAAGALAYTPPPLAELLTSARANRADLRAQALRIRSAEAAVGVARAQGRPTVDVSAQVGTGYSSLQQRLVDPNTTPILVPVTLADGTPVFVGGQPFLIPSGQGDVERTPIFAQGADNRRASFSLALTVPIFDRYAARRAVAEARIRTDDARLTRDALARQVDADVQTAAVEARTAVARLDAARVQVDAAAAALRVERDRYELGAGTLYAVADAQARLAQAESARVQAAYGLVFRAALVRLAVGDVSADVLAAQLVAP
jgi:outer membrane protein